MYLKSFCNVFVHKIATRKQIDFVVRCLQSGKRENVFIFGRVINTNA